MLEKVAVHPMLKPHYDLFSAWVSTEIQGLEDGKGLWEFIDSLAVKLAAMALPSENHSKKDIDAVRLTFKRMSMRIYEEALVTYHLNASKYHVAHYIDFAVNLAKVLAFDGDSLQTVFLLFMVKHLIEKEKMQTWRELSAFLGYSKATVMFRKCERRDLLKHIT